MPDLQAPLPYAHPSAALGGRIGLDKLLSAEQEQELASRASVGDDEARNRLVRCNLGLVHTIARGYLGRGLGMDDLAGEGNLGLIRAARAYKTGLNARFSTYAAHWIKQAIRDALTNTTATIRLPSHMVTLLSKWRRAESALADELGRAATFEQVAVTLGLTEARCEMVEKAMRAGRPSGDAGDVGGWSLDDGRDQGEGPEAEAERAEEAGGLRARMAARLDEREREIIALRFGLGDGEPRSLKEVGQLLGVSRGWVGRVERRAILKLRSDGEVLD